MSTPFKPLSEQVSNKMIADIKSGMSIFQRPNNSMNSALPFNLESGNKYTGPSALVLLMQKRDDPRWATSNQANRNHTAVLKGATGTMISFMSNYAIQKVFDEAGEPVLKDNNKQRTERVRLEEPILVEAWMFNAEQMRKMEKWEKEPNVLSPAERAQVILDNSRAVIEHGGDDMFYDRSTDTIVLPEKEQFANPEQYYAEALHQLAHWTAAPERLDRPEGNIIEESAHIKEELRTNLASFFLSKELNLPYQLNDHTGYLSSWSQVMKDNPSELFNAAEDAQKIVDHVLGYEKQIGQKQEAAQDKPLEKDNITEIGTDVPKINPNKLNEGEVIPYNGNEYNILSDEKKGKYQVQEMPSERKFAMSKKDVLFGQLLEARNNSQEIAGFRGTDEERTRREMDEVEQMLDNNYQIER